MKGAYHVVNVMRPAATTNEYGETEGQPQTVIANVPCSIETLSGRELELARQNFGAATLKVEMYGSPSNPIRYTDWLEFGKRKLNIGTIIDKNQNGVELSLICAEAVD